ncbi:MAG: hypothetical protein QOE93_1639 [Actinomycetota bacterium]|nr:hypothetical protein [Actinomycetota bacterium]
MAHELTHAEAAEFLGVYALDALDADERDAVELHLADCGLCQAELMEHLEVAGLLSSGIAGAPAAVWDRIAEELQGEAPPLDLATIHALRPPVTDGGARPVTGPPVTGPPVTGPPVTGPPVPGPLVTGPPVTAPPFNAPGAHSGRGARRGGGRGSGVRIGGLVAAASIAASVIGVLGLRVVDDSRRIESITAGVHGDQLERTINAAIADPKAIKVSMQSPDGLLFADAWMLPDGRAYLARTNLPALTPDRNYQLWAVIGDNRISVGLLGSAPEPSAFVADGPVAALAIPEELAGGVVASLQQPVVVGAVPRS